MTPTALPTPVLLHGFGTSARLWDAVLPLLGGPAPALIDLPGFGDSSDERYPVGGMADAMQERLAGVESFVLVGHSMGAKVATVLAGRRVSGLQALLLIAPSPEPMSDQGRADLKAAYGEPERLGQHYKEITRLPLSEEMTAQLICDGLRASRAAWNAWPDSGSRETIGEDSITVPVTLLTSVADRATAKSGDPRLQFRNLRGPTRRTPISSPDAPRLDSLSTEF